jgi:site-specific recombinase XerD
MSVPFLVPKAHPAVLDAPGRPSADPVGVYINRLGIGSRRGQIGALDIVAGFLLGRPTRAQDVDWASVRYNQTSAVRGWLISKYRPATCKRILAAVRGVLKESWRLGLMSHDDFVRAADIPPIRAEDKSRGRALSKEEIRKLFDACASDPSIAGVRDLALLAVLYGVGLRRSELVALNVDDYDVTHGTLSIHGKGDKPRTGYVLESVKVDLDAWAELRGDWQGSLFCPFVKGNRMNRRRMTPEGLAVILRKRAEQAGVEPFSSHDIRRTFITDLLAAGADLAIVQRLAGHKNISTTIIYDRRGESATIAGARLLLDSNLGTIR